MQVRFERRIRVLELPPRRKFMEMPLMRVVGITLVALAFSACSTTSPIVSDWSNPAYTSASFERILVASMGGDTSVRRNFEDEFVVQLRAAGIDASPSYRLIPEEEKLDEARLKQAAQTTKADAVLFARLLQVEQKSEYGPSYFPSTSFGIFGEHVGAAWHGLGGAPRVYRYNEYVSETTLHDVSKNDVVWTGTIKTTERENVNAAIKSYVQAVIKALQEKNLLLDRRG
jgi:hypothetical protein